MKIDFLYSTDFLAMNAPELGHTCMHLLCTAGEGSFVFNERCYHIVKNDLVVIPHPNRAKNLAAAPGMEVEWFAADNKYLQGLLPSNNYSIGGSARILFSLILRLERVVGDGIKQPRAIIALFYGLGNHHKGDL